MTSSDARTLATRLARLDADALGALLAARRVPAEATWQDFFDAAEALLDAPLVSRALLTLTQDETTALDEARRTDRPVAEPARAGLDARGLLDDEGRPFEAVREALATTAAVGAPPLPVSGAPDTAAGAAERAFAAASSLADVLLMTTDVPLGRIGSGALSAGDRRRLADAGAVDDPADADDFVAIAEIAGLLEATDRCWLVADAAEEWLHLRTADRWHAVARALRDARPAALRTPDGGWTDPASWPTAYPFDPAWPARAAHLFSLWRRWAMLGADGAPAEWAAGLARGGDADVAALRGLLPHEVDRVYLQNDLTAIAPGPLEPHLDMRLRTMARRESRAQAASYRFTAETIGAALTRGETAASLTEFLSMLSLTGVPQPLAYEIERGATRHGALRVGPGPDGYTRITGERTLLRTLEVDQTLRPLGLLSEDGGLVTRTNAETAFWMMADARYPVLAVDADGRPRVLERHRAPHREASPTPAARYAPLVERLRSAHGSDADAAWLERELERAVRARAVVTIVVRMPDGTDREVTVEAAGLGGGRLRGRDRAADVERTLPVASIVSVRPA